MKNIVISRHVRSFSMFLVVLTFKICFITILHRFDHNANDSFPRIIEAPTITHMRPNPGKTYKEEIHPTLEKVYFPTLCLIVCGECMKHERCTHRFTIDKNVKTIL